MLQADGKGVPLIQQDGTTRKKEAVVYSAGARVRSPEEVVASFYGKTKTSAELSAKPSRPSTRPRHKRLWATLSGKTVALDRLQTQVKRRQGAHLEAQVALCDADPALQRHLEARFPEFELILDFVHVSQYLRRAAEVLYPDAKKAELQQAWIQEQALDLLRGEVERVIRHLEQVAHKYGSWRRKILRQVAAYYRRNKDRMHYGQYLARGWPIATGVIEGACRHLVKDRCQGSDTCVGLNPGPKRY